MIRGTSKASLQTVLISLNRALVKDGTQGKAVGEQLFALVDAFDASRALRATVSDPSLPVEQRTALVNKLFGEGFDALTVEIAKEIASQRWTAAEDIANATEVLAIHALLSDAEQRGQLESVEHQIYRISRTVIGAPEIRAAMAEKRSTPDQRAKLARDILGDNFDEITVTLAARAASHPRGRRFVTAMAGFSDIAAERRELLIADVISRVPLNVAQRVKLNELLTDYYGRPVEVHVTISEDVVGGLRVQVGADVLDYTVLSRLTGLRRQLTAG